MDFRGFYDSQLEKWSLAKENCNNLNKLQRKPFQVSGLSGYVQFNPARSVSTLAKVDAKSIADRGCFLCRSSRPEQQESIDILPGWELLVNPYPILPYHLTIVNKEHIIQKLDIRIGKELADKLEGMTVFFNGAGAGASAPDHLHYQAVPIEELPLITFLEKNWNTPEKIKEIPFKILTNPTIRIDEGSPLNAFFWKSEADGIIKYAIIPRSAHRPRSFYAEPPLRRTFSPGGIDMAGILVTPFHEDFVRVTEQDILEIYKEVAYTCNK